MSASYFTDTSLHCPNWDGQHSQLSPFTCSHPASLSPNSYIKKLSSLGHTNFFLDRVIGKGNPLTFRKKDKIFQSTAKLAYHQQSFQTSGYQYKAQNNDHFVLQSLNTQCIVQKPMVWEVTTLKATLECTVARNVLTIHTTILFLDVGVCTDDFSQEENIIKLAAYVVVNIQTARK